MKFLAVAIFLPLMLAAATREECAQMVKDFAPLEAAYDAVVQSQVASPVSEKVIADFRRQGGLIYTECKDKMSTTPWYMLGKKIEANAADTAKFHMESVAQLTSYATNNPPVITKYICGTVSNPSQPTPRGR